jgi:hypothetical protein
MRSLMTCRHEASPARNAEVLRRGIRCRRAVPAASQGLRA